MNQHYPIVLKLMGKNCVVIGGGKVAERKVNALMDCGAEVRIISPSVTKHLLDMARKEEIHWEKRNYCFGDLSESRIAFIAVGDEEVTLECRKEANITGTLLNIADKPEWCDFILPSLHRQGELMLMVCTEGNSPMLAKRIRQELESQYGEPYGIVVKALGKIRKDLGKRTVDQKKRQELFQQLVYHGPVEEALKLPTDAIEEYLMKVYNNWLRHLETSS